MTTADLGVELLALNSLLTFYIKVESRSPIGRKEMLTWSEGVKSWVARGSRIESGMTKGEILRFAQNDSESVDHVVGKRDAETSSA